MEVARYVGDAAPNGKLFWHFEPAFGLDGLGVSLELDRIDDAFRTAGIVRPH